MVLNSSSLDALFLVDEPYLNGVPKADLERAARLVRRMAAQRGFNPRLGVTFASAMFNADFAKHIDNNAQLFVENLDRYRTEVAATPDGAAWIKTVSTHRLTTYDAAANMITSGGIPAGYDIVSFDFYASTLLFDAIHDNSLQWFAKNTATPSCRQFAATTVSALRSRFSFFRDGIIIASAQTIRDDAALLDQLFNCRMDATLFLLNKEIANSAQDVEIMLFAESSNNGLFEFDHQGNIESDQIPILIELRVLQEVNRSISYYKKIKTSIKAGLIFFTYKDEFDDSINLAIGGASNMPLVMQAIENAAKAQN